MEDLLGYVGVSTLEQNSTLQTGALKAAGCYRVFSDRASGARHESRELAKLFEQARPDDTVVVWRLDHLVIAAYPGCESATSGTERQ